MDKNGQHRSLNELRPWRQRTAAVADQGSVFGASLHGRTIEIPNRAPADAAGGLGTGLGSMRPSDTEMNKRFRDIAASAVKGP